jgi:hypothetical protein
MEITVDEVIYYCSNHTNDKVVSFFENLDRSKLDIYKDIIDWSFLKSLENSNYFIIGYLIERGYYKFQESGNIENILLTCILNGKEQDIFFLFGKGLSLSHLKKIDEKTYTIIEKLEKKYIMYSKL